MCSEDTKDFEGNSEVSHDSETDSFPILGALPKQIFFLVIQCPAPNKLGNPAPVMDSPIVNHCNMF